MRNHTSHLQTLKNALKATACSVKIRDGVTNTNAKKKILTAIHNRKEKPREVAAFFEEGGAVSSVIWKP